MNLELRHIEIKDLTFGDDTQIKNGVLTIHKQTLIDLLQEDDRILNVQIDIAKPGESCRILPVKDVIEPRFKEEGDIFSGMLSEDVQQSGQGVTYALKGCAVVTTGPIVGFQEGLIDMSGPAVAYSPFASLNNLVIHIEKESNIDQHEHEEVVRVAGLKAARWIGSFALKTEDTFKSTHYEWPSLEARLIRYSELPKVVYICNCMAQGLLHDTYFYGQNLKYVTPSLVSPTEFFDGALVSGNCVSPGSKTTTYHHLNNAVIKSLWVRHGVDLNFVGIIMNPLMITLKEKRRNIMLTVKLATEELGAEAALISQEGFGNPTTDLMYVCRGLENKNVKTVIITNEDAGTDGMSESLPDMVEDANAIITTGNSNATLHLPAMDRTLGALKEIERVTGGNVDSIQDDGRLIVEIHGIMGSHNLQGDTYLTAVTV